MCHLYAHLLRIPVLKQKNGVGIITEERFSHNGKIKANQHPLTLQCFNNIFLSYQINLVQPLIDISDTEMIDKEIYDYKYINNANDVKCILSGNLNGFSFSKVESLKMLQFFLEDFIKPVSAYVLNSFISNESLDYKNLNHIIEGCL